jgi:hypothetical protein
MELIIKNFCVCWFIVLDTICKVSNEEETELTNFPIEEQEKMGKEIFTTTLSRRKY